MATVPSVAAEEQHEQLRRFVDEWASERGGILGRLAPTDAPPVPEVSDISTDPIALTTTPIEHASIQSLIHTSVDNTPFAKLMTVAGYLCAEIEHIRARAHTHIFPALIAFGERPEEIPQEGELQLLLAHKLPLLMEAAALFRRLRQILQNLVLQLASLYPPLEPPKKTPPSRQVFASFRDVQLGTALESLGTGFGVLATLDEIIAWNGALAQAFSMFKRMLETVRSDPENFGFEGENVAELDHTLEEIKAGVGILGGGTLRDCFAADFYAPLGEMQTLRSKPGQFLEEVGRHVKDTLGQVTARVGGPNERPNDRGSLLGALCNYLLCLWLSGEGKAPDRKLGRPVWELHRRVPLIPLVSAIRVQPNTFLMAHLPPGFAKGGLGQLVKEPLREAATARAEYLARLDDDLGRETAALLRAASAWLVRTDSAAAIQGPIHTLLSGRLKLLVQGLLLASRVKTLVRTSVDLHTSLEVPISKEQIAYLGRLAGLLKAIEGMFFRRGGDTALAIGHMIRTAQERVRRILEPLRDAVEADLEVLIAQSNSLAAKLRTFTRGPSDEDVKLADALAATDLALRMTEGPPSVQRRIVLSLSLDVVKSNLAGRLPPELTSELDDVLMLLSLGADVDQQIRDTCDCSFLHWSRKALLPVALRVACQPPSRPHLIPDLVAAFVDGLRLLRRAGADDDVIASVEGEIEEIVTQEVIAPLCHAIETDLRLHNHSHTLTGAVTLDPTRTGVRDLSCFLSMRPIRLGSQTIVVKERLEAYLNAAFYDHTAVALHNWKAYSDMRQLAQDKYGLRLDDIHLPPQNLEHGQDVLFLMRNIHTLAQQYTYDLNGQVFIERPSAARRRKYLHTVQVRNIANGINTHGLGIVTTAVNFVYQFLAKRLVALSQALYDDGIKSRMVKERKYYREMMDQKADVNRHGGKGDLPGEYPVARAQKLIKDIKKLRKAESDQSALDVLRGLVGEIGNALGFVRMVANGASQHCAGAAFTPASLFTPSENSSSNLPEHSVTLPPEHSVSRSSEQSLSTPSEHGLATAREIGAATPPEHSVLAAPGESAFTPASEEEASTSGRELEARPFEAVTLAAGVDAPSAVRAARGLDETLRTLTERGAKDSAHYLRMLATVFSRELQTDQNRHLGTFFLLAPALMTSSTEAMLAAKEQLAKKGARETRGTGTQPLVTDDGFALGLAYLLEVLGQGRAFDSLGWLTSAQAHLAEEKTTCDAAYTSLVNIGSGMQGLQSWSKRVGGTTEAEAHNLELVRKRLELFMREFELQSLNFESARAFFL